MEEHRCAERPMKAWRDELPSMWARRIHIGVYDAFDIGLPSTRQRAWLTSFERSVV